MNKIVKKETTFAGRKLILETGELALRANMSVKATYGDTVVLATVVSAPALPDSDFLPLTVNYEEKLYSSGSIKSSRFMKRDGKSTDDAVIAQRAIDHAIRPLFPKDYMDQVQVIATVLSLDETSDPEFLSMVATSAALRASDIPCYGPMSTARVGIMNNELVLSPAMSEMHDEADLHMIVSFSGREKKFLAVEAGANIIPEDKILEAINFARDNVDPLISLVEEFAEEVNPGIKKYEYVSQALSEDVLNAVAEVAKEKVEDLVRQNLPKSEVKSKYDEILEELFSKFEGTYKKIDLVRAFEGLEKKAIRSLVLKENKRIDGRGENDIRPISSKIGILPRTHGSALFTRGTTQALTVATLGSPSDELLIQDMYGERTKRYIHYYNFPPYSVGEIGRMGAPKGREIGHGMIAEKALLPVIPSQKDFPYTILLVSEIISSNGSSSMASTCGSTLALMDAGVPIKEMVGGIAMGLIVEDESCENYKVLTDLCGEEDGGGFIDFKMTGTKNGVTAIQCDMKLPGIPMNVLEDIIRKSHDARVRVIEEMEKTISKPKDSVSSYAPKMVTTKIDPSKIGMVIGSGGKTIKEIQDTTGAEIFIEEDGTVVISSEDVEKAKKALNWVEGITKEIKVGEVYTGVVKGLLDFGALVEVLPGKVGLLHVSEITNAYVKNVSDWFKEGDEVTVKVVKVENEGKFSLSRKALEKSQEE